MKVLFHCVCMPSPHFEAELELMANHLEQGDDVYALACKENLPTCFTNSAHCKSACLVCQGRFDAGIRLLGERVHVVPFPLKVQQRYTEIPKVFDNIEDLKKYQIGSLQLGLAAASSLISRINREHRLDTKKYAADVDLELRTARYVFLSYQQILKDIKPGRVYLFNGRFSTCLPVINACEDAGIPFSTHERGGQMNSYYLVDGSTPHNVEYATQEIKSIWSSFPENIATERGSKFYEDRRKRVEQCWTSFTKEQQQGALPTGFDQSKRNIAFFNTTVEEYAAVRDRAIPLFIYQDEKEAIERIAKAFQNDPSTHFYLRVHPNQRGYDNSQSRDIEELGRLVHSLTVISPESKIDSYALMDACTTVVTFGSTMGAESCYWGKPSVLLGRAYYEALDCAYIPNDHDEAVSLLKQNLRPKSRLGAIQYGLWDSEHGIPFKRYKPNDLFTGNFLGNPIRPTLPQRIRILLHRAWEKKSILEIFRSLQKKIS